MGSQFWPLYLVVLSNVLYHLCARCASPSANPFAALTVTYAIAALASFATYCLVDHDAVGFIGNVKSLNWANYVLGCAIIGLEGGYLYMYRLGWSLSVGPIVTYVFLAIALLVIGALFFHEHVGWRQIVGTILCLGGIVLIRG